MVIESRCDLAHVKLLSPLYVNAEGTEIELRPKELINVIEEAIEDGVLFRRLL